MEQEPIPIKDLLFFILYLGSITFLLGVVYQGIILYKNKKHWSIYIIVILLTRIFTVVTSYFLWAYLFDDIDDMFLFLFLPACIAELIFSPLILKIFGN